jgi:methyltransferase family protein
MNLMEKLLVPLINKLIDHNNPKSFSSRMRRHRSVELRKLIENCFKLKGSVSIIDMGGEARYWNILGEDYLKQHCVSITLVNKFEENLPENPNPAIFTTHISDCCLLSYEDQEFDIAHSNSVIEHLIDWEHMRAFAKETRRVAHNYYVQTPSYWFPIEPHFCAPFFHWLPEPIRVGLVMRRAFGSHPKATTVDWAMDFVQNARLLDKRQFAYLFSDGRITNEKFAGLTKSFIAVRDARIKSRSVA